MGGDVKRGSSGENRGLGCVVVEALGGPAIHEEVGMGGVGGGGNKYDQSATLY